jgi:transcriptional regulator with XRE-family HTH domain
VPVDDQRVFEAIGLRIVELRQSRRVTQETLAARIGLDSRDLRRIEAGANTTVRTLNAIARALDVPLASIFSAPAANEALRLPGRPRVERAAAEARVQPPKRGRKPKPVRRR